MSFNQRQIIEQTKFTYSSLGKAFQKQTKTIEEQGRKQSGEVKLEEPKQLQNAFKSNLNEISKWWYKSEEQKRALENIKLLYKSQEAVIRLFNNYSSIVSEAKYKTLSPK